MLTRRKLTIFLTIYDFVFCSMAYKSSPSIICGDDHTLCIDHSGNVHAVGYSHYGSHGHKEHKVFPPKIIPTLNNITSVDIGEHHSVCLDNNGSVFTFGDNFEGQLGVGRDTLQFTRKPQRVNLPPCKQVCCGRYFTICLLDKGDLYSFGYNSDGQLGLGNNEEKYYSPQRIESLEDVEFVECGENYVFCKTTKLGVYCWGNNYNGKLGIGNKNNQIAPVPCSSLENVDVVDIKCNRTTSVVLTLEEEVFCCGERYFGQLTRDGEDNWSFGKIPNLSGIIRIECGLLHTMCIDIHHNILVIIITMVNWE